MADDRLDKIINDFRRVGSRQRRDNEAEEALTQILGPDPNREVISEMRKNRKVNMRRMGSTQTNVSSNPARNGANLSFATGRPRDPMFYWRENNVPYDVNQPDHLKMIRMWCNTPDAPIWMGDYSFKPIGEVQVGDEVMGWEWHRTANGQYRKTLVRTAVLVTARRDAPEVVKVTFESGRVIRCTPDHLWANPYYSPSDLKGTGPNGWKQPEYRPVKVGRELHFVVEPTAELSDEKQRLVSAWLGGLYDGEGCGERIAQCPVANPEVSARIDEALSFLGVPHTPFGAGSGRSGFSMTDPDVPKGFALLGGRQTQVDFLNMTNPVKRVTKQNDKIILGKPTGGRDRVVSIESEGPGEVVSMQTGTGNYVAWGFASKNCRWIYMSHPLISSAIDIFSKYPLTGMELSCKDEKLVEFYSELFFEQLNYEEFLVDLGRERWTVGEAWPLGSFNETLGVWEDDELINPDNIEVERSPFLKEPRFKMRLPDTIRQIIEKRDPKWEFEALMRAYPELANFMGKDALMPVSNVLLKQIKFKGDTFHERGVPIMMRGFRAIIQEEMLNAAQDAIADRLYTPLVLAKIGAGAQELGTQAPWIPNDTDLDDFTEALDAALAADFRVLTYHFAVNMETVFGKEVMPNLDDDYERLAEKQLQVFGLSKTMLMGAAGGETYAADALNRDLVSQLLTDHQRLIKRFFKSRMLVVAEAQQHYDYTEANGHKMPLMEEVLEIDEESGEERIVEQPKLLVPDVHIKTMNMQNEKDMRQFIEALQQQGVPISMKTRLINIPIDLAEEYEQVREEVVQQKVEAQKTRRETYEALKAQNLPIPEELREDFEPRVAQDQTGQATPDIGIGLMDQPEVQLMTGLPKADAEDDGPPPSPPALPPGQEELPDNVIPLARPPESDEMRKQMPKPMSMKVNIPDVETGAFKEKEITPTLINGPRHVGMRRYANIDKDKPLDEQLDHYRDRAK
jgi:hypothetical protein